MVAINTAVGQTDRINMPEIVAQGGTWGPLLCSNSIDKIGKFAFENGHLYKYKNIASIVPLAMVDDLLAISKCGIQSIEVNTMINTMIELKKLQFHVPEPNKVGKCHFMHIGHPDSTCPGMKIHGVKADKVSETTYLGDIIQADGKNSSNIKNRVSKGIWLVTEVLNILKSISFGKKYFEIAILLREAILLNGMLTNCEVWYSLGKTELTQLEKVDLLFLRKLFSTCQSTNVESFYLELGIIPISILLKCRRVIYLHYLASLKEDEMLYKMFITQWRYPVSGDWTEQAKQDLKDLQINMSSEDLKLKSKNSFKRFAKQKTKDFAFQYLLNLKEKHVTQQSRSW